jgi:glycerol kinase
LWILDALAYYKIIYSRFGQRGEPRHRRGAAFAAGLAAGAFSDLDDLRARWGESRRWQPNMTADAPPVDEGRQPVR